MDTLDARITAQLATLATTRADQHESVKARADHGRALIALALLCTARADDTSLHRARSALLEAIDIWGELGRARAAHLAKLRLLDVHIALGDEPELIASMLDELHDDQRRDPALARPYAHMLFASRAKLHAHRGELDLAKSSINEAIAHLHTLLKGRSNKALDELLSYRDHLDHLHK